MDLPPEGGSYQRNLFDRTNLIDPTNLTDRKNLIDRSWLPPLGGRSHILST
jgi:hypothetical protein